MSAIPQDSAPSKIAPVPEGERRPLWSVMIPTFNCAAYLRETLASVLQQDPGPEVMQIEVVDDVSTKDDPEAVVREMGGGRVAFHRQPANRGPIGNFNTCVERARGQLVHILHGDDWVSPGFYERVGRAAGERPDLAFFHVRSFVVDAGGALEEVSPRVKALEAGGHDVTSYHYENPFRTPGAVVRRAFYEAHGGFDLRLPHVADWEMWVRAIRLGGGLALNEPLAWYRYFPANHTGQLRRTGENLRDYLRLAALWRQAGTPGFSMERFSAWVADMALGQAELYRQAGDVDAAAANEALWRETASPAQRLRRGLRRVVALARPARS